MSKPTDFFLAEGFCRPCWTREFQQGTRRLLDLVSYLGFTGRGGGKKKEREGRFPGYYHDEQNLASLSFQGHQ